MIFEMTYSSSFYIADYSNKIAIHAKRRTIMHHDMQLLRDLWTTIAPESAIGADSRDTREQNELKRVREARLKVRQFHEMQQWVQCAQATGILYKLSEGV